MSKGRDNSGSKQIVTDVAPSDGDIPVFDSSRDAFVVGPPGAAIEQFDPWPDYYGVPIPSFVLDGASDEAIAAYGSGIFYDGPGGGPSLFIGTREQSDTQSTAHVEIHTGRQTGASGNSGDAFLLTGESVNGNSGNLVMGTGKAANGLVGQIVLQGRRTYLENASGGTGTHLFRLATAAADPSGGGEGDVYFNTTLHKLKVYANGGWEAITSA